MLFTSIVGARPQFVKLAPMVKALSGYNHRIIHTGQHYDDTMSGSFFRELSLPAPDINLGIGSGLHGWQTGQMLAGIEAELLEHRPDLVFVYGDTNSTMAGALAAEKLGIPVAHIEAGLRCFNSVMAEEINRIVADHVSHLLFCTTETSANNLHREGVSGSIYLVGDVMEDALLSMRLNPGTGRYVVATLHRAENTDDPVRLQAIISAIEEIDREIHVIFPVHPRTRAALRGRGVACATSPLSYQDMLNAVAGAQFVLTDSGGLQKEAYLLGVPAIVLRDETEYPELVECGAATIVGADKEKILDAARHIRRFVTIRDLCGDGHAAERIAAISIGWLEKLHIAA